MISLLFLINGCALTIPNIPVCREKDIDRGRCTYIVSGKSFDVDETHTIKDQNGEDKTWYEIRPYNIQVPIDSYAQLKAFFVKYCEKYKQCQKEDIDPSQAIKSIDEMISVK